MVESWLLVPTSLSIVRQRAKRHVVLLSASLSPILSGGSVLRLQCRMENVAGGFEFQLCQSLVKRWLLGTKADFALALNGLFQTDLAQWASQVLVAVPAEGHVKALELGHSVPAVWVEKTSSFAAAAASPEQLRLAAVVEALELHVAEHMRTLLAQGSVLLDLLVLR